MIEPARILNGTYEFLVAVMLAASPAPGVAKGGISFVALPNAEIRVFAARTSGEIPLPGHMTPLYVSVAPDVYRVELTFPGARPASRNVTVEAGRSIEVRVEDPKFDLETLVAGVAGAAETRSALGNGVRSFFRGDYDVCVKTLSPLSGAGNETARLFTAYAMAGSVLAGGREASPELPRARALFESLPARARPRGPAGVSSRILKALEATGRPRVRF